MAASASDIRAGGAFVEIYAKMSALDKGLMEAGKRIQKFGKSVVSTSTQMMGIGTGILAPLLAASVGFASAGADLARMSTRTGVAVETLSAMSFALEQNGASLSDFESALTAVNGAVRDAVGGNTDLGFAFSRLGLNLSDLSQMDAATRFTAVAEALARVQGPANRAALAMQVFGGSGRALLPFLAQGAEGMQALQAQARRLGLVMSTEDAQSALRLSSAFSSLLTSFRAATNAIGAALAPALLQVTDVLSGLMTGVIHFVQENRGMVVAVAAVGVGLVAAGAALFAFGAATIVAGVALAGLGVLVGAVLSPLGLVVAAAAGLAYVFHNELAAAFGPAISALSEWLGNVRTSIASAVTFISNGDIASAWEIVGMELQNIWDNVVDSFQDSWDGWVDFFTDSWDSAADTVTAVFDAFSERYASQIEVATELWDGFCTGMVSQFELAVEAIKTSITALTAAFQSATAGMSVLFGTTQGDIVSGLIGGTGIAGAIEEVTGLTGDIGENLSGNQENSAARRAAEREDRDAARARERAARNQALADRRSAFAAAAAEIESNRRETPSTATAPTPDRLDQTRQQIAVRGTFDARGLGDIVAARMDQQQLRVMQQQLAVLVQIERQQGREVAFG